MPIHLVLGGARSGKSQFAEKLAAEQLEDKVASAVTYIATAEVYDEEFKARIQQHQARRDASWLLV